MGDLGYSDILNTSSILIVMLFLISMVRRTKLQIHLLEAGTTITTMSMVHITFLDGLGYLCRLIDMGYLALEVCNL